MENKPFLCVCRRRIVVVVILSSKGEDDQLSSEVGYDVGERCVCCGHML